jgi:hypothetical protein
LPRLASKLQFFQVATITGMSHWCPAILTFEMGFCHFLCYCLSLLSGWKLQVLSPVPGFLWLFSINVFHKYFLKNSFRFEIFDP